MRAKRHRGHLALQYIRNENDAFIVEVRSGWSMIVPLSSVPRRPLLLLKGSQVRQTATNGDPSI